MEQCETDKLDIEGSSRKGELEFLLNSYKELCAEHVRTCEAKEYMDIEMQNLKETLEVTELQLKSQNTVVETREKEVRNHAYEKQLLDIQLSELKKTVEGKERLIEELLKAKNELAQVCTLSHAANVL